MFADLKEMFLEELVDMLQFMFVAYHVKLSHILFLYLSRKTLYQEVLCQENARKETVQC